MFYINISGSESIAGVIFVYFIMNRIKRTYILSTNCRILWKAFACSISVIDETQLS